MPLAHVFLPGDAGGAQHPGLQPAGGRLHGPGILGVPGLEQAASSDLSHPRQVIQLGGGRAGRLLQEHVLAPLQRQTRRLVVSLRRAAYRHRLDVGSLAQHLVQAREVCDAFHQRVAAGAGDELEGRVGEQGGDVLVACDLADANDGHAQRVHGRPCSGPTSNAPTSQPRKPIGAVSGDGQISTETGWPVVEAGSSSKAWPPLSGRSP